MIEHAHKYEYDVFKDSNLRYIGYSNEFGEAFRNVIPKKVVLASWGIESLYFFSDVMHKTYLSYHNHSDKESPNTKLFRMLKASSHTIVWQFFASVTIPALIINRVVKLAKVLVMKRTTNVKRIAWIPTFVGLACIPVMPYFIDPVVDDILDRLFNDKQSSVNSSNSVSSGTKQI